ncbi:mucin-2-like [Paramacrobiotus metropolitanus]|uniref:mucin-2-like n=1 Tax=Paramacrobiotus metropolitanus TaxID=2943436 RepID=UPI00244600C1|nr:mucin-2-like [Paramacrobiotus metropolitanus]
MKKMNFYECVITTFLSFSIFVKVNGLYNVDMQMTKWAKNEIPFYIDKGYDAEQIKLIRLAMVRVMSEVDMCVNFVEVPANSPKYKIRITPFSSDANIRPQIAKYCRSYAGKVIANERKNKMEQDMVLSYGPGGCFDGTLHSLMKFFAIALGKRNEHQGKLRDRFLQTIQNNIVPEMLSAYRVYTDDEAGTSHSCQYDYCSITHNQPSDFAKPGTNAFTVPYPPFYIPKLDQLSACDCIEIKWMYGCDYNSCRNFDCATVTTTTAPSNISTVATTVSSDTSGGPTICFSTPSVTSDTTMTFTTTLPSTTSSPTTPSSAGSLPCTTVAVPTGTTPPPPPPNGAAESDFFGMPDARSRSFTGMNHLRTINADRDFVKWADNTIRYYLDPSYSPTQQAKIRDAISRVMGDLNGFIRFIEVSPADPSYKLKITPTEYPGIQNNGGCRTFPGVYYPFVASNQKEQRLILTSGGNGCLEGNIGKVMKFFVIVLGRRNEHQRPDRDDFIQVDFTKIQPEWRQAYEKYTSGVNVTLLRYPYDYCSITHNEMTAYAVAGNNAFTIKSNQISRIPRMDRLSEYDCKIICLVYGCPTTSCGTFTCTDNGINGQSPVPGVPTGQTALPVTVSNNGTMTTVCYTLPPSLSDSTFTATTLIPSTVASTASTALAITTCPPSGPTTVSPAGFDSSTPSASSSTFVSSSTFTSPITGTESSSTGSSASSSSPSTQLSSGSSSDPTTPTGSASPSSASGTTGTFDTTVSSTATPASSTDSGSTVPSDATTASTASTGATNPDGSTVSSSSPSDSTAATGASSASDSSSAATSSATDTTSGTPASTANGESSASTSASSSDSSTVADSSSTAVSASSADSTVSSAATNAVSDTSATSSPVSTGSSPNSDATTALANPSQSTNLRTTTRKMSIGQLQNILQHMADEIIKQLSAKPTSGTGATPAPGTGTTPNFGPMQNMLQQIADNLMSKMTVTFPTSTTPMTAETTAGTSSAGVTAGITSAAATSSPLVSTTGSTDTTAKSTQKPLPLADIQQQLENFANQLNDQLSTTDRPGATKGPTQPTTTGGSSKSPMGQLEDALNQLAQQLGQLTKKPDPSGSTKPPKSTSPNPQAQHMENILQNLIDQLTGQLSTPGKKTTTKKPTTTTETRSADDYPIDPNAPPPPEEW